MVKSRFWHRHNAAHLVHTDLSPRNSSRVSPCRRGTHQEFRHGVAELVKSFAQGEYESLDDFRYGLIRTTVMRVRSGPCEAMSPPAKLVSRSYRNYPQGLSVSVPNHLNCRTYAKFCHHSSKPDTHVDRIIHRKRPPEIDASRPIASGISGTNDR